MDILELDRIISLLRDDSYSEELTAFRRSVQRLKIRLRNNKLTAQLKHLKTLIHRLEVAFPVKLFLQFKNTEPTRKSTAKLISFLSQFITRIDKILLKAVAVYGYSQAHFKVGHLVQHYIVIRASLARLIYCYKALLVYSVDLYCHLSKQDPIDRINKNRKEEDRLPTYEDLKAIILKHDCKPKQVDPNESPEIVLEQPIPEVRPNANIGQLIDRKTMRPVRSSNRVKN